MTGPQPLNGDPDVKAWINSDGLLRSTAQRITVDGITCERRFNESSGYAGPMISIRRERADTTDYVHRVGDQSWRHHAEDVDVDYWVRTGELHTVTGILVCADRHL